MKIKPDWIVWGLSILGASSAIFQYERTSAKERRIFLDTQELLAAMRATEACEKEFHHFLLLTPAMDFGNRPAVARTGDGKYQVFSDITSQDKGRINWQCTVHTDDGANFKVDLVQGLIGKDK